MPILRVNAAQSQVAIPVRQVCLFHCLVKSHPINLFGQTMLKTLYDHFVILYKAILPDNPSLASEHALKQEEDVYKVSTKLTYRNASLIILALSWTYVYL